MFEGLFQPLHLLIILVIALVIFGPGKLPELGASLGKGIKDFKKALSNDDKEVTPTQKQLAEPPSEEKK